MKYRKENVPKTILIFGKMYQVLHNDSSNEGSRALMRNDSVIELQGTDLRRDGALMSFLQEKLLLYVKERIDLLSKVHGFKCKTLHLI